MPPSWIPLCLIVHIPPYFRALQLYLPIPVYSITLQSCRANWPTNRLPFSATTSTLPFDYPPLLPQLLCFRLQHLFNISKCSLLYQPLLSSHIPQPHPLPSEFPPQYHLVSNSCTLAQPFSGQHPLRHHHYPPTPRPQHPHPPHQSFPLKPCLPSCWDHYSSNREPGDAVQPRCLCTCPGVTVVKGTIGGPR